jgi:hypothetical protein
MKLNLNVKASFSETRLNDIALVPQASGGFAQLIAEFGQRMAAYIPQFNILQITPNPLVGIEIGRIAGQLFPDGCAWFLPETGIL